MYWLFIIFLVQFPSSPTGSTILDNFVPSDQEEIPELTNSTTKDVDSAVEVDLMQAGSNASEWESLQLMRSEALEQIRSKFEAFFGKYKERLLDGNDEDVDFDYQNDFSLEFDFPNDIKAEPEIIPFRELAEKWKQLVYAQEFDITDDNLAPRSGTSTKCFPTCHPNGECQSGRCKCKAGFEGDGVQLCEDINECKKPNACGEGQECLNLFSSFTCRCRHGYRKANVTGSSIKCTDVDECKENTSGCHSTATCVNTAGSYECKCGTEKINTGMKCEAKVLLCRPDKIQMHIEEAELLKFPPGREAISSNSSLFEIYLWPDKNATLTKNCTFRATGNRSYSFELLPPFDVCGTVKTEKTSNASSNRTIAYENTIWWMKLIPSLPFVEMPFKMYDVKCEFLLENEVTVIDARPIIDDKKHTQTESGHPGISMKFWKSPWSPTAALQPLNLPSNYAIGEILYVTVHLRNTGIYKAGSSLYLDRCYVNSGYPRAMVQVISRGCPSAANTFKHGMLSNGESATTQFFFQVFQFQPAVTGIYVHCDVIVCKQKCKPHCIRRGKRSSDNDTAHLDHIQIVSPGIMISRGDDEKTIPLSRGPISPIPIREKNDDGGNHTGNKTVMRNLVLPIVLIAANLGILCLLGLLSYVVARSVAARRRADRSEREREGIINETIAQVSFSPPVDMLSARPSTSSRSNEDRSPGTSNNDRKRLVSHSHSFCKDKNCDFMKEIKQKNYHFFGKHNSKKRQAIKESMWKQPVFDSAAFTCPTPFNSPPPSPPMGPTVTSTGTSPIRVFDENRNLRRISTPQQQVSSPRPSSLE